MSYCTAGVPLPPPQVAFSASCIMRIRISAFGRVEQLVQICSESATVLRQLVFTLLSCVALTLIQWDISHEDLP